MPLKEFRLERTDHAAVPDVPGSARHTNRRSLLFACYSISCLYGAYLAALGVLLPRIGTAFNVDSGRQGELLTASFVGSVLSVLICGRLSDTLGCRCVLLAAAFLFICGLVLSGSAISFIALLCAAPLIGAGSSGMQAVSSALAADLYPEKRGSVLNSCQVAFATGAVVGPGVAYTIMENGTPWRYVYFGVAAIAACVALVIAARRAAGSAGRKTAQSWRGLFQPAFGGLCVAVFLYAGAEVGFFSWMPTYFENTLHAGPFWIGKVVSVFWLAMMLGRMALGPLLGRFGTLNISACLAFTGAAAALAAVGASQAQLAIAFVACTGLCFGGVFSTILIEAGDRYHSEALLGAAVGGITAASNLGTAVIPWAVGAVAASSGVWKQGLCLVPASALMAALTLGLLSRTSVQTAVQPACTEA